MCLVMHRYATWKAGVYLRGLELPTFSALRSKGRSMKSVALQSCSTSRTACGAHWKAYLQVCGFRLLPKKRIGPRLDEVGQFQNDRYPLHRRHRRVPMWALTGVCRWPITASCKPHEPHESRRDAIGGTRPQAACRVTKLNDRFP